MSKDQGKSSAASTIEMAWSLVESLENGDAKQAQQLVEKLSGCLQANFVQDVGKITRDLHETLVHLSQHRDKNLQEIQEDIPAAKERLEHVVVETEKATNETIDAVETCLPLGEQLALRSAQLITDWNRLQQQEITPQEFKALYQQLGSFLADLKQYADLFTQKLTDVLMAQEYQDLTGQMIQYVLALIEHVESSLGELVGAAKQSGYQFPVRKKEEPVAEGPVVAADQCKEVVANQGEVDDLLSSLGL